MSGCNPKSWLYRNDYFFQDKLSKALLVILGISISFSASSQTTGQPKRTEFQSGAATTDLTKAPEPQANDTGGDSTPASDAQTRDARVDTAKAATKRPQAAATSGAPSGKKEFLFQDSDGKSALQLRQIPKKDGDGALTEEGTLTIYYDKCAVKGDVTFDEVERNSRIFDDALLLGKTLAGGGAKADCQRTFGKATYQTQFTRSVTTVTAKDSDGNVVETKSLILGPRERFSLGIDLPVSNRKTLHYDDTSHSLVPKDTSAQLFLSFNICAGDVVTPLDTFWSPNNFNVKLMLKASSHPLDAYGAALGYRFPALSKIDLQGLSVFFGRFNDKEDAVINGAIVSDSHIHHAWRWGVSYDLSSAIKWVKF